jgi:hypothetical protein
MKTKFLLYGMIISIIGVTSCSKDINSPTADSIITTNDIAISQKMDNAIDDIVFIADDQYELSEGSLFGKMDGNYHSMLPPCVSVSYAGSTIIQRVITITFGTSTATCMFRGRSLKGQLILTRTLGTTFPKTMTITHNDFYINSNKLEGSASWKREMLGSDATLHPKTTFTMTNMTLTTSTGVYTRNGERIKEMTAGFLTRLSPTDDVFSTYGTLTTTLADGSTLSSLIEPATPLVHKTACSFQQTPMPFPVSGILKLTKNSHFSTIDYGNGQCDNLAMLSIDGGLATLITLGD